MLFLSKSNRNLWGVVNGLLLQYIILGSHILLKFYFPAGLLAFLQHPLAMTTP